MQSNKFIFCKVPFLVLFMFLFNCAGGKPKHLNSGNHNDRIRYLVIHHTTIDYQDSVKALTEPRGVSAHYLIPENNDSSYGKQDLQVVQLVDEKDRAWHAGSSYWQGQRNLNDQSIGIELVYKAPCSKAENPINANTGLNIDANTNLICFYPDFDDQQITLLIKLIKGILERNPEISASRIVGHADITPGRRIDPGPRFPWQRLYDAGIGAWYETDTVTRYWNQFQKQPATVGLVQAALKAYGYDVLETGFLDAQTKNALTVFQMHFRPWQVDGQITLETTATLFALIERYRNNRLSLLMARHDAEKEQQTDSHAYHYSGQIDGRFPKPNPSNRSLVNNKELFHGYKGQGEIIISHSTAKSADIFINGKNITKGRNLLNQNNLPLNIGKVTRNGFNNIHVDNIQPKGSHLEITIPYPELKNGTAASAGFSTNKLKKIDRFIDAEIKQGFPGAALLIIKNGKIIKQTAYGYSNRYDSHGKQLKNPVKMSLNTLFDMASNTKMYATNFALMKLVSEGLIDINKPLNDYLPDYKNDGREARLIKDLLTHSAGYAPEIKFFNKQNTLGESFYSQQKSLTQYLLTQRVPFNTGRDVKTVYSDTDYMLLGTLIERITAMPLDEYVETEIFQPLGLNKTVFNPLQKNIKKSQIAATELMGNSRDGKIWFDNIRQDVIQGEVHDEKAFYSMGGVSGHAGLFSTAKETAILTAVMMNRGGYGKVRLFNPDVVDQFIKPSDNDLSYGLGWRRAGNRDGLWSFGPYASPYAIGHTGWTGTLTLIDPYYDLSIILLTNRKHTPIVETKDGTQFLGDTFETGKYGSIVTMVYEAFLEK